MKEVEYIGVIEQLSTENKKLQNSKEYVLGSNIIKLKNAIKHCDFSFLFQKFKERSFKGNIVSDQIKIYDENYKVNGKCVIYTCITGDYDSIIEPLYINENFDYVLFTDNTKLKSSKWNIKPIPTNININNPVLVNRYIKTHPHEIFQEESYDYSIYIDGNIRIVSSIESMVREISDIYGIAFHKHSLRNCIFNEVEMCRIMKKGNYSYLREQTQNYKNRGFPLNYGLCECNVIITKIANERSRDILNQWWEEFQQSKSGRDQIALPYVLWKNNIAVNEIATLGENVFLNPKFQVIKHINSRSG